MQQKFTNSFFSSVRYPGVVEGDANGVGCSQEWNGDQNGRFCWDISQRRRRREDVDLVVSRRRLGCFTGAAFVVVVLICYSVNLWREDKSTRNWIAPPLLNCSCSPPVLAARGGSPAQTNQSFCISSRRILVVTNSRAKPANIIQRGYTQIIISARALSLDPGADDGLALW